MNVSACDDGAAVATAALSPDPTEVVLADGARCNIAGLSRGELETLQWEQERWFARRILDAPKGSDQRAEAVLAAYDTITAILAALAESGTGHLEMGLDPRYARLVEKLLLAQRAAGLRPSFFEIGYGTGALLAEVSGWGFPVAGIEASTAMHRQAVRSVGPAWSEQLLMGKFLGAELSAREHRYSLIYWNDVFEHIPPDEILDYLQKIYRLLLPGGSLVTITPSWYIRPLDATALVYPPRTEAMGLHLKEYTLREVTDLLRRAGFRRLGVPLFLTHERIVLCGDGLAALKRLFEPCLGLVPLRLAEILSRGLGTFCTIATKGSQAAVPVAKLQAVPVVWDQSAGARPSL